MPNKNITYTCEYCYREFNTITECEMHEPPVVLLG